MVCEVKNRKNLYRDQDTEDCINIRKDNKMLNEKPKIKNKEEFKKEIQLHKNRYIRKTNIKKLNMKYNKHEYTSKIII